MKIQVTAEDIREGVRESALCCPIANACKRAGISKPRIWASTMSFGASYHGPRNGADLPQAARVFIDSFDRGEAVQPIEFELEVA